MADLAGMTYERRCVVFSGTRLTPCARRNGRNLASCEDGPAQDRASTGADLRPKSATATPCAWRTCESCRHPRPRAASSRAGALSWPRGSTAAWVRRPGAFLISGRRPPPRPDSAGPFRSAGNPHSSAPGLRAKAAGCGRITSAQKGDNPFRRALRGLAYRMDRDPGADVSNARQSVPLRRLAVIHLPRQVAEAARQLLPQFGIPPEQDECPIPSR